MSDTGNSSGVQTVTIGNGYGAEELAQFKLPGYPVSRKGWYDRARRDNWDIREEPGKGRGGVRQIFIPPPDVQALIDARQRGDLPATQAHDSAAPSSPRIDAPYPPAAPQPHHKSSEPHPTQAMPNGISALFDQQVVMWAEPVIRLTLIVRSNHRFAQAPDEFIRRVALLAFRFVFMLCDGDVQRVNQWLNDAKKTDGLVHMAYEGDCIKRGIAPGSDLNGYA